MHMIPNFHVGSEDRKVPLRTAVFMACVSGAVAVELLNLPPRFAFAMVFASLMAVPKSPQEELEDVRREIAELKRAKLELVKD